MNSLELLQAIYRDADLPLQMRMRAAISAAPYESPRLSMTAVVTANDFDKRLELAITRSNRVRLEPPRWLGLAGDDAQPFLSQPFQLLAVCCYIVGLPSGPWQAWWLGLAAEPSSKPSSSQPSLAACC
jgi:hypothetical protein